MIVVTEQEIFERMNNKGKLDFAKLCEFTIDEGVNQLDFKYYYVIHAYDRKYTISKESVK
jgi:hypothetical protein